MSIHLIITVLGILAGFLLFARLPKVMKSANAESAEIIRKLSVVIPARNEAATLGGLLDDLTAQTQSPLEVIVVDDASEDATATVAHQHGANVVRVEQKPDGWTGKTYACHLGAQAAAGEILLFLDADVRLAPDGLARLAAQYASCDTVITVQPRHTPITWVEQLSLLFNLIAGCTLANQLPLCRTPGLYGPVLMIGRTTYARIGGHWAVRTSVVEDLDLGLALDAAGIPYHRFLGGRGIDFRMYPGGLRDLFQGFVKNFSLGAAKTNVATLLLIVLWVTALCRVPIELLLLTGAFFPARFALFAALYLILLAQLFWAAGKVGRFRALAVVLYPVGLLFFVLVFAVSLYKKLFHRPVVWKGRKIQHGEEK